MNWRGEVNKALSATYKNWIISKRNVFTLFELVFWPLISILSIGLLAQFLQIDHEKMSFLLVGAIGVTVLQVCQIDVAYVLLFDMWSKSIKNTFLSPVRGYHLILGSLAFGMIRGTMAFALLVTISHYLFGFNFLEGGPLKVIVFLGGVYAMSALIGIVVCVSILTFGQKADVAAWSLSGLIMLICGIYYPIDILPPVLQYVARAIPITYFIEYYRSAFGLGSHNVVMGIALATFYFIIGLIILEIAIGHARRNGNLLRLSE